MKKVIKKIILILLSLLSLTGIWLYFAFQSVSLEEKKRWQREQEEMTKGDVEIYSQWDDRFGWIGSTIYTDYETTLGGREISRESGKHKKEIWLNYEKIASKFPDSDVPYKEPRFIELTKDEFLESEYAFITDCMYEFHYFVGGPTFDEFIDLFWKEEDKVYLYTIDNKYLIYLGYRKEGIKEDFYYVVDVYDLETKEPYIYPISVTANQPKDTDVSQKLIMPRYRFKTNGTLLCTYKFYNKLYCHRLN